MLTIYNIKKKYLLNLCIKDKNTSNRTLCSSIKEPFKQQLLKRIQSYINILNAYKLKFQIKTELLIGYSFNNIIDNYFASTLLLVLIKLSLSLMNFKLSFYMNMTILLFLWIISIKYNIYKKIKLLYIKIILKTLHEKYLRRWDGIDHSYVEEMNITSKYMLQ